MLTINFEKNFHCIQANHKEIKTAKTLKTNHITEKFQKNNEMLFQKYHYGFQVIIDVKDLFH